jgi:cell division protein FtsI/penicillin-binding protein 2
MGTGTDAAIAGVLVAGKTGTAETPGNSACGGDSPRTEPGSSGSHRPDHPRIATAASGECTEQFGNDVAAPYLPRSGGSVAGE